MKRALLVAALMAAGAWYLMANPPVARAVAVVAAVGTVAALWQRHRRAVRRRNELQSLGALLSLTPVEFEEAVAGVLARSSYRRVRVLGGAADLGIDIACVDRRGRTVVVQCKRHAPGIAVGSGVVQRFLGSITHAGADRGILVTTSRFSSPAVELAGQHNIELIDGEALARLAGRRRGQRQPVPSG